MVEMNGGFGSQGMVERSREALMPFLNWLMAQGVAQHFRVVAFIALLADVQEGRRVISTLGVQVPDYWMAAIVLTTLRDQARAAGFAEAVACLEQDYAEVMAGIEQVVVAIDAV
jgi:hypothetical protein